ncbi:hypothetical protein BOX15_Mlig000305g2 [Macrostomum lignano]|uniref:RRM domain-containing protein n=1 Tax=Macrostomum lignano TaxID=282301 RepID=A0A267DL98_9PLAT|nr:hypothetical protein BOX15_Mlig024110g1 [Macrostomum lignano]PAA72703.1 hypothetical protein BOX15_Mlig000305g2 [Macrostomum lignano]
MPPKAAKSKTTKTAAATASAKKTQKQQKVSAEVEADDSLPGKSTPGKKRRRTLPIRPARQGGHCVLISHLPDGLREPQLRRFLSQFGRVHRVRVPRSKSGAGNAKGIAFVEMAEPAAAKTVAETLDNYLMFTRLLRCKVVPDPKRLTFASDGRLKKQPKAKEQPTAVSTKDSAAAARGRSRRLRAKLQRLKQLDPEFEFA